MHYLRVPNPVFLFPIFTQPHFLSFLLPAGFLLFKDFCMNEIDEAVPQLKFYEEVSRFILRPPDTPTGP